MSSKELVEVGQIKLGTYVRKAKICSACKGDGCLACEGKGFIEGKTTFTRGQFDRSTRRYSLSDFDDVSREVFVAPGTMLSVNFTF